MRLDFDTGATAAMTAYGVDKVAIDLRSIATKAKGALTGPTARRMVYGDPAGFAKQLREGKLLSPGGMLRQAIVPQGAFDALFNYGLPAYQVYSAAQLPPDQRGSAIGAGVGQAAGAILGQPFGMLGQMGGSMLMSNLGATVGSNFNSTTKQPW